MSQELYPVQKGHLFRVKSRNLASPNSYYYLSEDQVITNIKNQTNRDGDFIDLVSTPTHDMWIEAIKHNQNIILNSDIDFTEDHWFTALSRAGFFIKRCVNPSYRLCVAAINNNPSNIEYIENQTPELCKLAISLSPSSIDQIKNQTAELCLEALELMETKKEFHWAKYRIRIIPQGTYEEMKQSLLHKIIILKELQEEQNDN